MNNTDLELFKQALREGTDLRIRSVIASYTEKITCSEKHTTAMTEILDGRYKKPLSWSDAKVKIAAIIIAATMLLAGCAIIYKEEIRGFIEHIYEEYIEITFTDGKTESSAIEEVYELTYLPEGYYLESSNIIDIRAKYIFSSADGKRITFSQTTLSAVHGFDNEHGYKVIKQIGDFEIYYKQTDFNHNYLWNDGKYSLLLTTSHELSEEDLISIINGIQPK